MATTRKQPITLPQAIREAMRVGLSSFEPHSDVITIGHAYEAVGLLRARVESEMPALIASHGPLGSSAVRAELRRRYRQLGQDLAAEAVEKSRKPPSAEVTSSS